MVSKNQIKFVRQLEQKKHRLQEGLFVAEGPKVVGDLLAAGHQPKLLFSTEQWQPDRDVAITPTIVTSDELRRLSFLQHPQSVLAVFPLPTVSVQNDLGHSSLLLALDGVQDPGNMGTIIRVADWFGISRIVCSKDTVDAWSPKVVQATMGSIARVNICYTDLPAFLCHCGLPVYGTLLDGENIYTTSLPSAAVIVMGNEGKGISPEVRELVTHRLLIPAVPHSSSGCADSLNVAVATAITCSEFCRSALQLR